MLTVYQSIDLAVPRFLSLFMLLFQLYWPIIRVQHNTKTYIISRIDDDLQNICKISDFETRQRLNVDIDVASIHDDDDSIEYMYSYFLTKLQYTFSS